MTFDINKQEDMDTLCFMDFRAEKELCPETDQSLKFIVFGGILGDHPPQDRAKDFREKNFKQIRNLKKVQMTTDTALMVTSEIQELRKPMSDMKFTENPEVPIDANSVSFLDHHFSIDRLADPKNLYSGNDFEKYLKGDEFQNALSQFNDAEKTKEVIIKNAKQQMQDNNQNPDDIFTQESTVMEGFTYRKLDDVKNQYPVLSVEQNGKVDKTMDFPILPVGMRALWAQDNDLMGMF